MAACRTCKNAAAQHPTYLFTRCKNSQTANLSVCPSPPCTTAIYRRKHHACMHACMQNLQNRQACSQTGAAGFAKSGRSRMAACRTCKNAAVQHPTYLFTRCKNSQTGNLSVCPSPPCTVAIYRENRHACMQNLQNRQAGSQTDAAGFTKSGRSCMAACRTCKNAAVQHPTYLFTRCKNSQTGNWSVCPSPPCTTAIYRRKHHACMHACMQNLQNRQACSQTGAAGFAKSGRSRMAACRTCKNAAVQHPTYLFTRCKNSQTGNLSVCPSPPCTVAIYRENRHACMQNLQNRQAGSQTDAAGFTKSGRSCMAACRTCKNAAVQHPTYLFTRCKNSQTGNWSVCPSPPCTTAIYRRKHHACMHACMQNLQNRQAGSQTGAAGFTKSGRSCMAACRTCKNAAVQHPTYLFTRCKNSQTGNLSVCPSPPCTVAIYRENTMHACRTCKTGRQAAKRALPDLLSRAGAAWQHAGHARMQRCSILHTYSLDAKTRKLQTCLFAPAHHAQPLSIGENTMHACMHACRTCKTGRHAAKRALPDLLSRAGAAWQHAGHARMQRCSILHTYSLDAKTHKLETCLFAPAHHAQSLSIEKTAMHACRTCKTGRQAAKRTLPDLLSRAGAAWQHAGHARMQRCSILHTYSLDAKTHKLETCLFAPAHHAQSLSIEKTPCMHAC